MSITPTSPPPTVAETLRQETQRKKSRIAESLWPKARLIVEILYHQVVHDRTFSQAAALTYKTLFSLLPVCVLSLLVLSTISRGGKSALDATMQEMVFKQLSLDKLVVKDANNDVVIDKKTNRPLTARTFITPLLEKAKEAVTRPTTGIIAFGILLYGSISLMTVIESTFNFIYGGVKPRSWPRRIMLYWCVLTLGPIFIASSILAGRLAYSTATGYTTTHSDRTVISAPINSTTGPSTAEATTDAAAAEGDPDSATTEPGMTATEKLIVMHNRGMGIMNIAAGFLLSWSLTFFMYKVIPDTRVNWWSALIGSWIAAILWEFCKWGFSLYVNHALRSSWYGSLVLIPLFMLWIYLTWSAILLGLQVAYMHQFFPLLKRRYFFTRMGANVIADVRWVLSLGILLCRRFAMGKGLHPHEAAELLMLPNETTGQLLDGLEAAGIVHITRNNAYALARSPESITAHDLLSAARALCQVPPEIARENPIVHTYPQSMAVTHLAELEARWARQQTLKDLAEQSEAIHLVAGPSTALIGAAAPGAD